MEKCKILGVEVDVTNLDRAMDVISSNIDLLRGNYICVSNVHTLVMSYENENYRNIQNTGFMVLPDGRPLSVVSRLKGHHNAERVAGPDLMGKIFATPDSGSCRHYFYGSTEETLISLKKELNVNYPELVVAGMYSPPFRELTFDEDNEIIKKINETNPDIVWVGLGAPKQELWMKDHAGKIGGLMIGVGAGFDYFAGNINRAPGWMQKLSLEWFYRLIQDPGRLWKRYLVFNTKFIFLVIKESIGQ